MIFFTKVRNFCENFYGFCEKVIDKGKIAWYNKLLAQEMCQ
jgi:hypothetical protein